MGEGSSDAPLADIVAALLLERGLDLRISRPDLAMLNPLAVGKGLAARITAGMRLLEDQPEVLIVHRDVDRADVVSRREEIRAAAEAAGCVCPCLAVLPIRMTEAWLLLDEPAIRFVAGNPRGRADLGLPKWHEVERVADPKALLRSALLAAAETTGRRRERDAGRFESNRRQLLERLDVHGPVSRLSSWAHLIEQLDRLAARLR